MTLARAGDGAGKRGEADADHVEETFKRAERAARYPHGLLPGRRLRGHQSV